MQAGEKVIYLHAVHDAKKNISRIPALILELKTPGKYNPGTLGQMALIEFENKNKIIMRRSVPVSKLVRE